jgi:hypothetical protein
VKSSVGKPTPTPKLKKRTSVPNPKPAIGVMAIISVRDLKTFKRYL